MANIPNTSTAGQTLLSRGNGTNASYWGTSSSGGGLPTPSGDGAIPYYNGAVWASTDVPSTGSLLYFDGTDWTPTAAPTINGQILEWNGSLWQAATNDPAYLAGYPVVLSSPVTGEFLEFSGSEWVNASSSGGVVNNSAWAVNGGSGSLSTTLSTVSGWSTSVSGFTNYLVTITGVIKNTSVAAQTSSIALQWNYATLGSSVGVTTSIEQATSITCVNFVTGQSPSATYNVAGLAQVGSGSGTFYNGTIAVIGIS
jgi:hypothetical protein